MVKKFHMRGLNMSAKKPYLAILKFSILMRKITKFWKIWIFECNLAPNYSSVRKFHIKGLDLNTKILFSMILGFSIL